MPLVFDNPDVRGVREGFADEELTFWDLPFPSETFNLEGPQAEELDALCEDYRRIGDQASELRELMPANAEKINRQHQEAIAILERKVKKILGNRVRLVPPPHPNLLPRGGEGTEKQSTINPPAPMASARQANKNQ